MILKNGDYDVELISIKEEPYGHGTYRIKVVAEYREQRKRFMTKTHDMESIDQAREHNGQQKELLLYGMISYKLNSELYEWLDEINEQLRSENDQEIQEPRNYYYAAKHASMEKDTKRVMNVLDETIIERLTPKRLILTFVFVHCGYRGVARRTIREPKNSYEYFMLPEKKRNRAYYMLVHRDLDNEVLKWIEAVNKYEYEFQKKIS